MRISVTLLSYEHGVIRQVLDVLAEIVRTSSIDKHFDHVVEIVDFLDSYMDKFHHKKEERFVFPAAMISSPNLKPEIEELLHEHRRARQLLGIMIDETRQKGIKDLNRLSRSSKALVEHVTIHIQKEESSVFPKIEDAISIDDDIKVDEKCREFTRDRFGEDFHQVNERFSFRIQDEVLGAGHNSSVA
ncbi:MAG: hemerythrin domain-containing protein [Methanomassiliicoccales archaeon]|nr:hemerythrin domain-containing protein [Methanomassiliicoccales archaeon]